MAETPAPQEKPAAAKPKAAPKKQAPPAKPLEDNGDGTLTDPTSGLTWKKSDAWLDMKKFYLWQDHREYVDKANKEKFAGYDNWRIPSKAEALTLFDKTGTKKCMDKNGVEFPIDPHFDPGCVSNTWISECSDEKIIRMDLKIGVDTPYPGNDIWSSIRLVRKPGEAPPPPLGTDAPPAEAPAESGEAKAAPAEGKAAPAAAKPAAAKPAGDTEAKPTKIFTPEERAAMLKRAKAWAAEKAKKG